MASIAIHDQSGNEVGTYEVSPEEFAPRINKQLLHDVVVMYQANRRQGSAKTKNRGEVKGSTRKLYRQKGTGNARMGSRRSGQRRGGGHIFALRPRDFSQTIPKKARRLATRMAIASKIQDNQIVILDSLSLSEPKTKEMATILKNLGCDSEALLVTTASYDEIVYKSARNIAQVSINHASQINALDVLSTRRMLVTKDALDALKERARATQSKRDTAANDDA